MTCRRRGLTEWFVASFASQDKVVRISPIPIVIVVDDVEMSDNRLPCFRQRMSFYADFPVVLTVKFIFFPKKRDS